MRRKLLLLSFIEGGAVMAAELCGAKLLAPVFGGSLYVWASVMGVTLGALALGYFSGGYYSSKAGDRGRRLYFLLMLAGLLVMAMPLLATYLVSRISYLPFLTGLVISSMVLLLPPVFLLGATSPFFIALQANDAVNAGRVSGTVYAVSTVGGIFATFICGFWLIPSLGLNASVMIFGGSLFVATLLTGKTVNGGLFFLFIVISYLLWQLLGVRPNVLRVSDGLMGRLEVKETVTGKDTLRYLAINSIIQSEIYTHSSKRTGDYIHLFDTLISKADHPKSALVLGMGAGLSANALVKKNYRVHAVEIDERIVDAARDFFALDTMVNVILQDARRYINHNHKKYDLVMYDVFKAEEQPSHVLTMESIARLRKDLTDSALILINWHGYLSGETGLGTSVLMNTLQHSGLKVKMCSMYESEDYRNIIFVASARELGPLPFEIHEPVQPLALENTDDLPLMEKYNALANKRWRANYLRYYQQK